MKIKELRDSLQNKDQKLINDALVEIYKLLPKAKKEDADILLNSMLSGQGKVKKAVKETVDLAELIEEVNFFLKCVYEGLYISPNRFIKKSERSKWRFKVKRYLKVLLDVKVEDPMYPMTISSLLSLYEMLSKGTGYYILPTEDPFQSIERNQADLLQDIIKKMLPIGIGDEDVKALISIILKNYVSYDTIKEELFAVLLSVLCKDNQREQILTIAKEIRMDYVKELKKYKPRQDGTYKIRTQIEEVNQLVFMTKAIKGLQMEDVDEYIKYSYETDKEIDLYCMLKLIEFIGCDEDWILVYKYMTINKKVKARNSLIEAYRHRKEENQ